MAQWRYNGTKQPVGQRVIVICEFSLRPPFGFRGNESFGREMEGNSLEIPPSFGFVFFKLPCDPIRGKKSYHLKLTALFKVRLGRVI